MYLTCIQLSHNPQSSLAQFDSIQLSLTSTLGWNNVVSMLCQRCATLFWHCVTLFRHCFNVGQWHSINVVQRLKSDIGFCLISNVGSTLFQWWFITFKQRWSNVEMLAWTFPLSFLDSIISKFINFFIYIISVLGDLLERLL